MKNILIVCSGGMSSAIVEKTIEKEAKAQGIEIKLEAIGSGVLQEELGKGEVSYDMVLVAPQVSHMFDSLKQTADSYNIPIQKIEPREYSPLGGKALLEKIKK